MNKHTQILEYIKDYIKTNGFSPSIQEICDGVGLKSKSCVHRYLNILEERGKIKRVAKIPRALVVVGME